MIRCAISGSARGSRCRRDRAARGSRRVPLARPRPARRAVGGAGAGRQERRRAAAAVRPAELRDLEHEPEIALPAMPLGEHVIHDYRSLGLSLKAHPVSFLRSRLARAGVYANADLPRHRRRPPGVGGGAGAGAPAAGQRQCDLPDAGGREALSPTSSSGRGCSNAFGRSCSAAASSGRAASCRRSLASSTSSPRRFEDLTPWLADLTEVAATRRQAALPARAAAGQAPCRGALPPSWKRHAQGPELPVARGADCGGPRPRRPLLQRPPITHSPPEMVADCISRQMVGSHHLVHGSGP